VSGGKECFIARDGCGANQKFPMRYLPKLSKALSALNLMRCISADAAYEQLFGKFDINHSLAPPGIKVVETPSQRHLVTIEGWQPLSAATAFMPKK
jgi:hypothetical protein